jgi:4-amino-4-deoxy-L-arabinose transferase-like glycosyltransferase
VVAESSLSDTRAAQSSGRQALWALAAAIAALTAVRIGFVASAPYPLHWDEAQYWGYGLEPAFGYYSKPPMVAWLIALTTAAAGDSSFGIRLASPFLHAGTALLAALAARRLFGIREAVWAGLTWATLPAVGYSAGLMTTDPPMLLFYALALLAYIRAIEGTHIGWWLLAGLALGLALLSKYTALAFIVSAALHLATPAARHHLRTPGPWLAFGLAFLVVSPNLAWNAAHGFATILHVGENAALGGASLDPGGLLHFVAAQFGVFGPVLMAALILMLLRWRDAAADPRQRLLLAFVWPLLALITAQSLLSHAYANWAAPSYVAASIAVPAWLLACRREAWLKASLMLHLAVALVFTVAVHAIGRNLPTLPQTFDPFRKLRVAEALGDAVRDLRQAHPEAMFLGDDREVSAYCLYYAGIPPGDIVQWDPDGIPANHYELASDPETMRGRTSIHVAPAGRSTIDLGRFADVRPLPQIVVRTHADRTHVFDAWLLRGFEGYLQ